MYKDGNSVSIDLLDTSKTLDRNGVEVKIPIEYSNYASYINAIQSQLIYFENIYLDVNVAEDNNYYVSPLKDFQTKFNNYSIKKYDSFSINSLDLKPKITLLLGKVSYKINEDVVVDELHKRDLKTDSLLKILDLPIALNFEIGDLEVTPNREQILYSKKSIEKIISKMQEVSKELWELTKDQFAKDFTSPNSYLEALGKIDSIYLVGEDGLKIFMKNPFNLSSHITYKGVQYPKNTIQLYDKFIRLSIKSSYIVYSTKIQTNVVPVRIEAFLKTFGNPRPIIVTTPSSLNTYAKIFLREKFNSCFIIPPKSLHLPKLIRSFYKEMKYCAESHNIKGFSIKVYMFLVRCVLENLGNNTISFNNNSVPQSYIDSKKAEAKKNKINTSKPQSKINGVVTVKKLMQGERVDIITKSEEIKPTTKLKKLYIYAEPNNIHLRELKLLLDSTSTVHSNFELVEIAISKFKFVENNEKFIHIDNFNDVYKYKLLRKIGTAVLIKKELPIVFKLSRITNLNLLMPKLHNVIRQLSTYSTNYSPTYNERSTLDEEIYDLCLKNNYFDEEMRAIIKQYKPILEKLEFLCVFYEGYSSIKEKEIPYLLDYIIARKMFKPEHEVLIKYRQNLKS